ncbi:hypothetical protein TSAR_010845 [Trichomalopsis sarcophagae]|uniref:Uncharacterized protein n=1 Tax=Trichomalopsis sarcophagae TaxID=543379 RepID=A0A232F844_9HYME|nr:hypothetical protein TSAR_010845 [Trichomalopsis sarcophagae]
MRTQINLKREYLVCVFPFIGYLIGWKLDRMEDERLSKFRDKSALYRRDPPPAEPSW